MSMLHLSAAFGAGRGVRTAVVITWPPKKPIAH